MYSIPRGILNSFRQHGVAYTLMAVRNYKVRTALKLMCSGCRFVKRKGVLRVICKVNKTHKQKQGWGTVFIFKWNNTWNFYLNTFIFASTMNLDIFRDVLSMIDLLWMQLVVNLERDTWWHRRPDHFICRLQSSSDHQDNQLTFVIIIGERSVTSRAWGHDFCLTYPYNYSKNTANSK